MACRVPEETRHDVIGKSAISVPIPGFDHVKDFVCLLVIPFDHSGELVVYPTGATHGALRCCPGHGLDGWTPTDRTDTRATEVHSSHLLLASNLQLTKREAARATDPQEQQLLLASRLALIERESATATADRSSNGLPA